MPEYEKQLGLFAYYSMVSSVAEIISYEGFSKGKI